MILYINHDAIYIPGHNYVDHDHITGEEMLREAEMWIRAMAGHVSDMDGTFPEVKPLANTSLASTSLPAPLWPTPLWPTLL